MAKPPPTSSERVRTELLRRGLDEAEIEAALRKKRRRKPIEFAILKSGHVVDETRRPMAAKRTAAASRTQLSDSLCTVEFAAAQLQLHPKTVLRSIREGRLRARRVGKAYRILRSDLEAFAGLPAQAGLASAGASVTSIIDIPGVDADLARRWSGNVASALKGRPAGRVPLRADVVHEAGRWQLKIVVTGSPVETMNLLSLIHLWLDQLGPRSPG